MTIDASPSHPPHLSSQSSESQAGANVGLGSESSPLAESAAANAAPTNAVITRDMTIDDLAPVFHLGEQLFQNELYPTLYRTWDEWEVTGLYNTDPEYCLIAEVEGEFAGFVLGTVIEKQVTYGYINWLGVDHRFQRRGVADSLVDRFVERTIHQGARSLFIDTDPANEPAVKFFTRKGFDNVRRHVYMSLDLGQHPYFGRLIDYEQDQVERTARKHRRRAKG
ncbi:GNAT family N-acetyltransferase [Limnothrix redekei LRLZ20PSL1]|uniref:GNAT family N-acetyltransferase n=2 Tax=Limnothrix TaxID=132605 RepID=A0ABW7CCR0_9CYAN